MTFEPIRHYARHILRPLMPGTPYPIKTDWEQLQPSSSSTKLQSTKHCFTGTGRRIIPASWSYDRFEEDPESIPDDAKYTSIYDPQTAISANSSEYRLFASNEQPPTRQTSSGLECDQMYAPRIVVKRYIPNQTSLANKKQPGLTLVMLAGMGLPKEVFEPLIETITERLTQSNVKVDEIWAIDMPMSGETATINPKGYLYGIEKDIARDLLIFLTSYLPLQAGQDLPFELPLRSFNYSERKAQPVRQNLHIIAHSMGGQASILACSHTPQIAKSLTLIDPAIIPPGKVLERYSKIDKKAFALGLRQHYTSMEDLQAEIRTHKRTKGWDERIQAIFCQRAGKKNSDGSISLVAHPRLEWALYYDLQSPVNAFDRLTDIDIPINAIMPERPFAVPAKQFEEVFTAFSQRKKLSWIPKVTHQLPFEKIDQTSNLIADWLIQEQRCHTSARL